MSANERSGHAIVLGASIAGLLAARVLSESFAKVTIVDRDELPAAHRHRKGVPQGEHTHGLLARGRQILEELFDGFIPDLVALGALPVDLQRDSVWVGDGHAFPRTPSGILGLDVSRPTLEGYVRQRVGQLSNVEFRQSTEAVGLVVDDASARVTGARLLPKGGTEIQLAAQLVVDATGRGNRGPTWLAEIGYDKPAEEAVDAVSGYMSRIYRRVEGDADYRMVIASPSPANPFGGVLIAVDGDRWMVTLVGCDTQNFPPSDPEGFLEFTKRLSHPAIHELLSKSEPLSAPMKMRLPVSVRRRYEWMKHLPEGFVAVGDAMCAFNPAYGQGMTIAAVEAIELRDCLRQGREGLPRRYFAKAAKAIDVPWDMAVGGDLRFAHVVAPRPGKVKFLNSYIARLYGAAGKHPVVAKTFLGVANLVMPPTALFKPGIVARVLLSGGGKAATPAIAATARPRELEPSST
ncbi:FAD-binding monooxygenase [Rhizocola hellebori]|uniref:FAD-binding monooxygenase n=1 Tax=Rhizocola hellebori TaxID=1392758 RepID=A0A8J3QBC2_9ACTN|nr:FAD-binding protein [Rhizocola hellebori]GIH07713.1 FAD-binding monooxygenase [Rhizocola hellebori]